MALYLNHLEAGYWQSLQEQDQQLNVVEEANEVKPTKDGKRQQQGNH
jgi:hypothetical protein